MTATMTIDIRTDDLAIAHWDDALVTVFYRDVTLEALQTMSQVVTAFARERSRDVGALTYICRGVSVMVPPEIRRAAADHSKFMDTLVQARTLVIEGEGFRASALRSVLIGIGYMQRNNTKIASSIDSGVEYLAEKLRRPRSWSDRFLAEISGSASLFPSDAVPETPRDAAR